MSSPLWTSRASLGGLDFGVIETSGVAWVLNDLQGWGSPASTVQAVQKPRSSGGWAGPGYLPARVLSLTGTVDAPSTSALSDAVDRLNAACSLTDTTLTVIEGGRSRYCTVRRQGEVLVTFTSDRAATWSVQVVALDPRKYGSPIPLSTNLPSSTGGLTWPLTWPLTWTATQVTGVVTITNPGNATGPVTLRINGPVTGPSVTHIGSGLSLTFSSSLTLNAGEWLDVDMEARTVLANGQSSRSGWVTSRGWFGLEPGDNQFAYGATAYNPTTTALITGWPTWM